MEREREGERMTEDETRALYWFTSDYHSGQWSRGYRLACKAYRRLHRLGYPEYADPFALPLGTLGSALYARLESAYANKL